MSQQAAISAISGSTRHTGAWMRLGHLTPDKKLFHDSANWITTHFRLIIFLTYKMPTGFGHPHM